MNRYRYGIFAVAALLLFSQSALSQETTRTVNFDFPVGPGSSFKLSNISGDVRIQGWDQQTIKIEAVKYGKGSGAETKIDLVEVDARLGGGNRVVCEVIYPKSGELRRHGLRSRNINVSVKFDIFLPKDCMTDVNLVSGDLNISDLSGSIKLNSVSGDIEGAQLSGDIRITVVSGDITIDGIHGAMDVETTSGDIDLATATGSVKLRTTSGDLTVAAIDLESAECTSTSGDIEFTIDSPLTFGRFMFKTYVGDVVLNLDAGSVFEMDSETDHGDIDNNFGLRVEKYRHGQRMSGSVGGGGARIYISTKNGDITVDK